MSLATLIKGHKPAITLPPATAILAIPAIFTNNQTEKDQGIATVATIAIAESKQTCTPPETAMSLWRWFVLEADRVYQQSPKATDSWERHKEHKLAAVELCNAGCTAEARGELEKALAALQGAAVTQPRLITEL